MIHHLSIAVRDLKASSAFYDATLSTLGYVQLFKQDRSEGCKESVVAYGRLGTEDGFAIRERPAGFPVPGDGFHLAFAAATEESVINFYREALVHGGRDHGPAGLHPEHGENYFAAFVFDPDGYRIEAVVDRESAG